jgi:hypothetical protein
MRQPHLGERVWIVEHPDVPEEWRATWGRVAVLSGEHTPPRVTVIDVMGRHVEVDLRHVRAVDS